MSKFNELSFFALLLCISVVMCGNNLEASAAGKSISSQDLEYKAKIIAEQNIAEGDSQKVVAVSLKDENLCIYVDGYDTLDPHPLPKEAVGEVAYTHAEGIAENILNLPADYGVIWKMIIVNFSNLGEIRFDKKTVQKNQNGSLYFPSQYPEPTPQNPWFTLDKTSRTCSR